MCKKILAHTIIYRGVAYRNHLAALMPDSSVSITPFDRETPGTLFVNGTVEVEVSADGRSLTYRKVPNRKD